MTTEIRERGRIKAKEIRETEEYALACAHAEVHPDVPNFVKQGRAFLNEQTEPKLAMVLMMCDNKAAAILLGDMFSDEHGDITLDSFNTLSLGEQAVILRLMFAVLNGGIHTLTQT